MGRPVAPAGPTPIGETRGGAAGITERMSHTFVLATMSAAAMIAAQTTATWLFFTSKSPWVRPGASAPRLRARAPRLEYTSIAIVARRRIPVSTPASSDGNAASRSPLRRTENEKRPRSVPQSVPRPPNTEVPPSTTAVIASSS